MQTETDVLTHSQTGCWVDKKCDVWLWRESCVECQQRNIYWHYIAFVDVNTVSFKNTGQEVIKYR